MVSDHRLLLLQMFTLMRIPLAMILAGLLLFSNALTFPILFLCFLIIGIIELSDIADGIIARRVGIVTEWGAMLDPYADSISRLIVYWAFAVSGLVNPLVPMAMAFRDITVAYCRITLSRFGNTVSAKLSGKIKAIVQGVGAILIVFGPLYWRFTGKWTVQALSWIVIITTLISIIEYAQGAILAATQKANGENKDRE